MRWVQPGAALREPPPPDGARLHHVDTTERTHPVGAGGQSEVVDAVVIGAGPNGLVAANALADAGWSVLVLESQDSVGGAVRSAEIVAPGYVTDLFSAFYPLAKASPVIRDLHLEDHGLRWRDAPSVMGHAFPDGRAAILHRTPEETAAGLEAFHPGDGDAWLELHRQWSSVKGPLLDALFTPFPPVRAMLSVLRSQRLGGLLDLTRLGLTPVRRLGTETFGGDGGPALLAGNAMHSDLPPDGAGSGFFGWLLCMLGQDIGFPVPEGGAGVLAESLRRRAVAHGAEFRTGSRVTAVTVKGGRAVGVEIAGGGSVRARRAVLADVVAPALYRDLLPAHAVPAALLRDLDRFEWDGATIKVNWALDSPVPWSGAGLDGAGTVHLGVDNDGLLEAAKDISLGRVPERPFLLFGQMTTADPTRSPAGTESAWAYTHAPSGLEWSDADLARHVDRMRAAVEQVAPGFGDHLVGEHVQSPQLLEEWDANLVGGAINGGTSGLHQQLVLRPTPGLGRPETPVEGLYLASASAHPGGGVHGACGWNAARAALGAERAGRKVRRALVNTAWERVLREPGNRR